MLFTISFDRMPEVAIDEAEMLAELPALGHWALEGATEGESRAAGEVLDELPALAGFRG